MSMEREKKGEGGGIGGEDCALPIAESTLVFFWNTYTSSIQQSAQNQQQLISHDYDDGDDNESSNSQHEPQPPSRNSVLFRVRLLSSNCSARVKLLTKPSFI